MVVEEQQEQEQQQQQQQQKQKKQHSHVVVEELLQLLVTEIDANLLEGVEFEDLKTWWEKMIIYRKS